MKDDVKVESSGGTETGVTIEVLVSMPDKKIQKLYHFDVHDKVWNAKLHVINDLIKNVKDAANYGFYDPPCNGKSGKFLEEERLFTDYPLSGSPPVLEFKNKRRIYRSMAYEQKTLQKLNVKTNQKKFLELVSSGAVSQVGKMAEKGIDPNFHDDRSGETPLTVAVTKDNAREMIVTLVNGGALLDYRTQEGLTPLHRAAIAGKAISVKTLLDFGASPNYKDLKGLTPLFYTAVYGGDPYCCEILLNDQAELHIADHQGKQEIHLACKNGLVQHLEHLLFYGAQIDARTASGNTALHVAALSNQDECARVLLFRGAKRNILNYANQSAYEVAAVGGNKEIAELIKNFSEKDIVKFSGKPSYSTRRRKSVSKPKASSLFPRTPSETQLSIKSDSSPPSPDSSIHSLPSTTASETASVDEPTVTMNGDTEIHNGSRKNLNRTLSASSTASDSSYGSESDSGEMSPRDHEKRKKRTWRQYSEPNISQKPAVPPVKAVSGAATIRKRLYASVPGRRFVAIKDYRPLMAGELALEKGDEVEVLFVGEKGYWEGRVGNSTGWFHHSYVEEKKGKGKTRPKTMFARPPSQAKSNSQDLNHVGLNNSAEAPRIVTLLRSSAGFGFQMRGANSQVPRLNFEPTAEFPALQYFGELETGGQADLKGIKAGDFILEVNGEDVRTATHGHVVALIQKSVKLVNLKIVTAKSPAVNGTDHKDGNGNKLPPPPPNRDPSTTLTLGRMSTLSSSRPSLFEMSMGESFEEPASYRVDSVITVSKENRWHSLQRQKPQARKPVGVQMKSQTLVKRRSSGDLKSGGKIGYQRAHSVHNMLPPSYESVVGKRPLSAAVPVDMPVVPDDPRLPRSMSVDNTALSKYHLTAMSTPNLDKPIIDNGWNNGYGSPPKEVRRDSMHGPYNYGTLDRSKTRAKGSANVEAVVTSPVKATVVAEQSTEAKPEITVVATPVEVVESTPTTLPDTHRVPSSEVQSTGKKAEKPALPPKPRTLTDALQEAVAARNQRISRKSSAPETEVPSSIAVTNARERRVSTPTKLNPRKTVDASQKVRSDIMTRLEEKFTEDDCKVEVGERERCHTMPRQQEKQYRINKENSISPAMDEQSDSNKKGLVMSSSADILRRYTSPTRDMNRQSSLDTSEAVHRNTKKGSENLQRQLSEPVSFDRQLRAQALVKPPAAPSQQIQLGVRGKPAVPPPPPTVRNKDIPSTPVTKGLITADALSAKKSKLKSTANEKGISSDASSPARGGLAPTSGTSPNLATQHSDLLAKAVAARAARISTQSHSDADLNPVGRTESSSKYVGQTASSPNYVAVQRGPDLKELNNNKIKSQVEVRAVNSRGKPSPPVAPKKRFSSLDLRQRKYEGEFREGRTTLNTGNHSPRIGEERSLPFEIPAPVLSEEDKSVMFLDEVIRKEAESENWSLNSWNSGTGSDSSSEVFVPPPVWPAEQNKDSENLLKPWYESSSQSEESIPAKTSEPEKVTKTITTKKGFQIKLTIESKRSDSSKPVRTSSRTDSNDMDISEPLTPRVIESTRTDSQKEMLPNEAVPQESDLDEELKTPVVEKESGKSRFELPPPPDLFTDKDEPHVPLDSPPLPPPPEFSPRESKTLVFNSKEDTGNRNCASPSAESDASSKDSVGYTDISSIFGGYSRPMQPFLEKPVLDWDCDDVCGWLDSINMAQYKETFRDNDIQGIHLPELTKAELRELGVKSLGHRMTLETAIARLSQPLESNC